MAVMAMNLMMDCSAFVQQKSPVNTAIVDSGIDVKKRSNKNKKR